MSNMMKLETVAAFTDGDRESQANPDDGVIVIQRSAPRAAGKTKRSPPKPQSGGERRRAA